MIARASSGGCICGSMTANVVKPLDFKSGRRALNHFLVVTAWCWRRASDTRSMQALFGPVVALFRVRKALVKAMSISVRFSTPLSLNTFGKL